MVRVATYVLVLAVATLGAGCSAGTADSLTFGSSGSSSTAATTTSETYQPTDDDRTAIRALLKARSQAVADDDRDAFLATVDSSDQRFTQTQRTLFDNLAQLPVTSLRYVVDDGSGLPVADLAGDDPEFRPSVVEQVRLDGVDRAAVGNPLEETFVRRGGRWLLGAESEPGSYLDSDEPQSRPWAGSVPITVARSGDLVVVVDEEQSGTAQDLADAIADDIRFDAGVLGLPPAYDVLVDATSVGEVHKMNTVDDREAAAVTVPVFAVNGQGRYTRLAGVRIKINPDEASTIAADPHVVRHELTHYLTLRSMAGAPTWLKEGVAEYVSTQPAPFIDVPVYGPVAAHVLVVRRALPSGGRWGLDPDADYLVARAAVSALVEAHGMDQVLELARAYRTLPGDDPDQKTDRVLRRTLGTSEADLVAATWALLEQLG